MGRSILRTTRRAFFRESKSSSLRFDFAPRLHRGAKIGAGTVQVVSKTYTGLPDSARKRLIFAYDFMGRRVKKSVEEANGAAYNTAVVTNFVYDGWNLLADAAS
jgi:hypothetical protein